MNLYDQLLKLQVIENAYTEWEDYRAALTQFIISTTEGKEELAVFGAGRCNDIDLNRLLTRFRSITLIDKDEKALLAGVRKQGLEGNSKIKIEVKDFVGISEKDYRVYADFLVSEVRKAGTQTRCEQLAERALWMLHKLDEKASGEVVGLGTNQYEVSVVAGVHSQLLSMLEWIWSVILQTLGQNEMSVRNHIIALNTKYVERFNKALINATKDRIIVGYEIERAGRPGGIQGAAQAAEDIARRVREKELTLLKKQEVQWLFNKEQQIIYNMSLMALGVE